MNRIDANPRTIKELLIKKFTIDYYQREFQWEIKQISELLHDLTREFIFNYEEGHTIRNVENYKHYYLGSILLSQSDKNSLSDIIDGQQRLTSITLILIYIYHSILDKDLQHQIFQLISSYSFGKRDLNIDFGSDTERTQCMKNLFDSGQISDDENQSKSVKNIIACYQEIKQVLSDKDIVEILPLFTEWLMERVYLVEITAFSTVDAYTIFETVNDRGLSLTPTDMLKGYLFSKVNNPEQRKEVNKIWQDRITSLHLIGKDEEANAIKSFFRSQHAESIQDFENIGSGFHRWLRDKENIIGLSESEDFVKFIKYDLDFYAKWYKNIRLYVDNYSEDLDAIYYNNQNNFTLQFPVLLSALVPFDSEENILHKLQLISQFLDILIHRYIWNSKRISESSMRPIMFQLISTNRKKSVQELSNFLFEYLENDEVKFTSNKTFKLTINNRRQVHRLLARMTDYIEVKSGITPKSHYTEYTQTAKDNGYEIEHIWANHFERYQADFKDEAEFSEHRNRVGGLLLLQKKTNASYGDKAYNEKYDYYFGQNQLAASLHEKAYKHSPFLEFIKKSGLAFRPHSEFKKEDLDLRQELYLNLAETIWNPKILEI